VTSGAQLATHFLDKAFQATFRVPPVILTNRREFLLSQLRVAFPKHAEAEFHNIFRLYDRLAFTGKEGATPRNIKIFVNKLGSLHRQWQHRIPFTQQAAFVLWAERNESVLTVLPPSGAKFVFPNLPGTISALLNEDWPRNFVALYFKVDPKDAYQVLLSEPIRKAIQTRDKAKLVELEMTPGFPEVMESTVEDICGASTATDSTMAADAAVAFSDLKGNWQGYENCKAHLWRNALSFREWEPFDAEVAEGIKSLVQTMPATSDIAPIVRAVANSLKRLRPTSPELNTVNWCAGLGVLMQVFKDRDEVVLKREFRVSADPENYLDVIKEVEKGSQADLVKKYLIPTVGMEPIFEYLAEKVLAGKWDEYTVTAVEAVRKIDPKFCPEALINALRTRIDTDHRSLQSDLPKVLETALLLSLYWTDAEEFLNAAAKKDSLFQILGLLPPNEESKAIATCILPLLGNAIGTTQMYRAQPNTTLWNTEQGKERALKLVQNPKSNSVLMQTLAEACLRFHTASQWRQICEARPEQKSLIFEFLRMRLSGEGAGTLETEEMVEHTDFWKSVLSERDFSSALDLKAKAAELSVALIQLPFDLSKQDIYATALAWDEGEAYRGFLSKSLGELTEPEWTEALQQETVVVEIAIRLQSSGLVLSQAFQDALAAHVEWSFSQDEIGNLAESWGGVPSLLRSEGQAVLKQRLWNSFNSESGSVAGVIPYYGELLSEIVRKYGPESAFKRIVQIISDHEESQIKWLEGTLSRWIPRTGEAKACQSDWRKRVETLLGGETGSMSGAERAALSALRDVLKPRSRPSRSSP
jgi:hypothetical protein